MLNLYKSSVIAQFFKKDEAGKFVPVFELSHEGEDRYALKVGGEYYAHYRAGRHASGSVMVSIPQIVAGRTIRKQAHALEWASNELGRIIETGSPLQFGAFWGC